MHPNGYFAKNLFMPRSLLRVRGASMQTQRLPCKVIGSCKQWLLLPAAPILDAQQLVVLRPQRSVVANAIRIGERVVLAARLILVVPWISVGIEQQLVGRVHDVVAVAAV